VVKKITHSLNKDSLDSLDITLRSVIYLLDYSDAVAANAHELVDAVCAQKLVALYSSSDDGLRTCVHSFFLALCGRLAASAGRQKGPGGGSGYLCASNVIGCLNGSKDSQQRDVELLLLLAYPSLLPRSIANVSKDVSNNWAPVSSSSYIAAVAHLGFLASHVPVASKIKTSVRQWVQQKEASNAPSSSSSSSSTEMGGISFSSSSGDRLNGHLLHLYPSLMEPSTEFESELVSNVGSSSSGSVGGSGKADKAVVEEVFRSLLPSTFGKKVR
jgi:hypothetical protein